MKKSNLTAIIYNQLKQRIIQWEYPPDYHLTEDALCQEFNVSRIPVREALRMLEENNLVEKIPHRGCMVKQPNLTEVNEIYDVRLALETHVVELLTRNGMNKKLWQELYDTWQKIEQDLNSPESSFGQQGVEYYAELDQAFHAILALAAGNHFLCDTLNMIDERLHFLRLMDITSSDRLLTTCEQHLTILKYIKTGDIDLSKNALQTNINFGHNNVQAALHAALAKSVFGQSTGL